MKHLVVRRGRNGARKFMTELTKHINTNTHESNVEWRGFAWFHVWRTTLTRPPQPGRLGPGG